MPSPKTIPEHKLINGKKTLTLKNKEWDIPELLRLIPNYDPFVSAINPNTGKADYVFMTGLAQNALDFFEYILTLFEGVSTDDLDPEELERAAADDFKIPFKLEPWQAAIVANIFGWVSLQDLTRKVDGVSRPSLRRRYRNVLIYVPRKNGKTPLAAGLVLYSAFCDNERGPQVYCAASTADQASLVFRHMMNMIEARNELKDRCHIMKSYKKIEIPDTKGHIKVLSSDAGGAHGQNVSAAIIDEVHAHKNRDLIDTLRTATGSRKQPLLVFTTTADFERESICNEIYNKAKQVIAFDPDAGTGIYDPRFLPVVYEIEDDEDIHDVEVQKRVNPNFGISIQKDFLDGEIADADQNLGYLNTVLRLYFNKRTKTDVAAINMSHWNACTWQYPLEDGGFCDPRRWRKDQFTWLKGEPCFAGMDLSSESDLTSIVFWFPNKNIVIPFFWLPGVNAAIRQKRDNVPYPTWCKYKYIRKTKGNAIDQEEVMKWSLKYLRHFGTKAIGVDPHNASWVFQTLETQAPCEVFKVPMTASNMTTPIKEVNTLIANGTLNHGGNPVLAWNAQNLVVRELHDGRMYPHKLASSEKIDGMVAFYIALAVWRSQNPKPHTVNERGGKIFSVFDED